MIQNIWNQYDWMVGTRTIKGPNKSGKYAILDLPECGKELVITWSSDEGRSDTDSRQGMEYAFSKCYKKARALGAEPLAITNCLNFGHPTDSMGAFSDSTKSLGVLCNKFRVPVVGGNVSLYNGYKNHSIKPTPILVMVGTR